MRLATITNWAYGATVVLTLVSGTTMLWASDAQERERAAVEQRYQLDKATSRLGTDVYTLTDHARQYLIAGDPTYKILYTEDVEKLASVEERIGRIGDAGASAEELATLEEAIRWADALHAEQESAILAFERGDENLARQILFGPEYERELDRVRGLLERFQDMLDSRTATTVQEATRISRLWEMLSEIAIALTGLLFLCVLYFIFKQRVLRPVVKLSDVISRLAAQDYAAEPPEIAQIDEIGDMAQAIRVFRENGIERLRLEAERSADLAIRDKLSSMTQRLQSCDTLSELQEVVQRFVPEIVPDHAGRLYLLEKQRNVMVEACQWLDPRHSVPSFPPISCWALRRGQPHQIGDGNTDVPCWHFASKDTSRPATLCLPLTAQRETLGLLYLEVRPGQAQHAPTQHIYFGMLAENIGLALANLRLREALREMAMGDALTGLANRRRLNTVLETQLTEWAQKGESLSCMMVDIDHFKRFNDIYGHDAGDKVLTEVGNVLKSSTRDPELAFRYGGEEFTLLLPAVGSELALERAEELRAKIAALRISHSGEALEPISASVGLATAPGDCTWERLVQSADAALLRAKTNGRDRVEVARTRDKRAKVPSAG